MMNILDGILIVILLLSIWSGYRQGLVLQLVKLAGLVLSFAVAFFYYKQLAVKLMEWFPLSKLQSAGSFSAIGELPFVQHGLYNVIAFFILASLTGLIVRLIGGAINNVAKLPVLSLINGVAGGVVGFLKSGLILFILLVIAYSLPLPSVHKTMEGSAFASYSVKYSPAMGAWLKDMIGNQPKKKDASV